VVIGVVPERTEMALALTPSVEAAVPLAVTAIRETLVRFGAAPTRRLH